MANTTTFIKIDRNIERWRWYGDKNTLAVWIHFLLKANVRGSRFAGKLIKRGQYAFSRRGLSAELGMSERAIRTSIDHLVETGEIQYEGFPRFSIITVVNYDKYQAKPETQKQKPKETVKQISKKHDKTEEVPKMYREMFGDDYEAYKKWREQ